MNSGKVRFSMELAIADLVDFLVLLLDFLEWRLGVRMSAANFELT